MNVSTPRNSTALSLRDRLPFSRYIPLAVHNHVIAFASEYIGTVFFLYLALTGMQVAMSLPGRVYGGLVLITSPEQLLYISLCFGFSLAINAWIFFRVTSGLFNPAVTFGMCLIGSLSWLRGAIVFVAQLLGAMNAAALVSCMFPGPLRAQTRLGNGTSITRGLFIEMILTAIFVFAVFMMAAERHKGTFIAPIGIGLALFVCELCGLFFTGGSLNPARSLGPAVAAHHFDGYHWIYWVGPLLGSIIAAALYKLVKILEHETATAIDLEAGSKTHQRNPSTQSTVMSGHHGPLIQGAGRTLDPVREDDVDKDEAGESAPGVMASVAGGRYNGAASVHDQAVGDTSPRLSNERKAARRSAGGASMSKRDRILAGM